VLLSAVVIVFVISYFESFPLIFQNDDADIFHTFFGISGLSLLGHLHNEEKPECNFFRQIDPVYALPTDVVQRLGLQGQVMVSEPGEVVEDRLKQYDILVSGHKLFQ